MKPIKITNEKIIDYYDGPMVYIGSNIFNQYFLFYFTDQGETTNKYYYLMTEISDPTLIQEMFSKKIDINSYYDSIKSQPFYIYREDGFYTLTEYDSITDFIPDPGVFISSEEPFDFMKILKKPI